MHFSEHKLFNEVRLPLLISYLVIALFIINTIALKIFVSIIYYFVSNPLATT